MSENVTYLNPCKISINRIRDNFVSLILCHLRSDKCVEGVMTPTQARKAAKILIEIADQIDADNPPSNDSNDSTNSDDSGTSSV